MTAGRAKGKRKPYLLQKPHGVLIPRVATGTADIAVLRPVRTVTSPANPVQAPLRWNSGTFPGICWWETSADRDLEISRTALSMALPSLVKPGSVALALTIPEIPQKGASS